MRKPAVSRCGLFFTLAARDEWPGAPGLVGGLQISLQLGADEGTHPGIPRCRRCRAWGRPRAGRQAGQGFRGGPAEQLSLAGCACERALGLTGGRACAQERLEPLVFGC